jgi:hypothetical protein
MPIQGNTDHNIEGHEALVAHVEGAVASSLNRYSTHITRTEIHLSDENDDKGGQNDKRYMMDARLEGRRRLPQSTNPLSHPLHGPHIRANWDVRP